MALRFSRSMSLAHGADAYDDDEVSSRAGFQPPRSASPKKHHRLANGCLLERFNAILESNVTLSPRLKIPYFRSF